MTGYFTSSEKWVAVAGNASVWLFAALAQDFMWVAAGVASISTSLFMLTKWILLIRAKFGRDVMDEILDVDQKIK